MHLFIPPTLNAEKKRGCGTKILKNFEIFLRRMHNALSDRELHDKIFPGKEGRQGQTRYIFTLESGYSSISVFCQLENGTATYLRSTIIIIEP